MAASVGDVVENIAEYPRNQPATRNNIRQNSRATREARCRRRITPANTTSSKHITAHGTAASRKWKGTAHCKAVILSRRRRWSAKRGTPEGGEGPPSCL